MARPTEGFRIRPHPVTGIYQVRFTLKGEQREFTTGKRDPGEAAQAAARKYAEAISGRWDPDAEASVAPGTPLDEVAAKWIAAVSSALDEKTVEQYEMYAGTHWTPFFGSLDRVLTPSVVDYTRHRLAHVKRRTVLKELSALRGFLAFCQEKPINNEPVFVPPPQRKATGTPCEHHKADSVPLEPSQVAKILEALPEWSTGRHGKLRFAVRNRFVVSYETGLRPSTLDEIEAPRDYRKGAKRLKLRDEVDKARFGREVPLTKEARKALDAVIRGEGLIFGRHDYRDYLKPAAKAAKVERWREVSPYDFRHARGTHLTESSGGNLTGVAFLLGHKRVTTTAIYIHPSQKAAERVLDSGRKKR